MSAVLKTGYMIVDKSRCILMTRIKLTTIVILARMIMASTQAAQNNGNNKVHFEFQEINIMPNIIMRQFGDFDGDGFEEIISSNGGGRFSPIMIRSTRLHPACFPSAKSGQDREYR